MVTPATHKLNFQIIQSGYRNQYYYTKCLTCAACGRCLAGKQFFSKSSNRFCCRCYEKVFGQKCAKCLNTFTGMGDICYILYDGRTWHPGCFLCNLCGNSMFGKSITIKNHNLYCNSCISHTE